MAWRVVRKAGFSLTCMSACVMRRFVTRTRGAAGTWSLQTITFCYMEGESSLHQTSVESDVSMCCNPSFSGKVDEGETWIITSQVGKGGLPPLSNDRDCLTKERAGVNHPPDLREF